MKNQFRILVADDNPSIHEDFKKILIEDRDLEKEESFQIAKRKLFEEEEPITHKKLIHYEIDFATQGKEALLLVQDSLEQNRPYSVAFIDVLMPPGWDGVETTKHLWEKDPHLQIVICTAYAEYSWDDIVKNLGLNDNFVILKKPFESIEIKQLAAYFSRKWLLEKKPGHRYDKLHEEVQQELANIKKILFKTEKELKS